MKVDYRPPKENRTHKRGDVRGDGFVFWGYSLKTPPDGETWLDQTEFNRRKKACNDRARKNRKNNPQWRDADRKRKREWYREKYKKDESFRKKQRLLAKEWSVKNPEKAKEKRKRDWIKTKSDPLKREAKNQKHRIAYKKLSKEQKRLRQKETNERNKLRYQTDIQYRIRRNLKGTLANAIKYQRARKKCQTIESIGCGADFLKAYLEARFQPGMTWDNYGTAWHIDHVKPLASFDLSKKSEQLKANHYTNLQPMWAKENLSKGKKTLEQTEFI